jgi:arylsulfatase A-like enzyme
MRKEFNALLCTSLAIASCNPSTRKEQLPNIVFIIADDLGYGDLSCYGQKKFSTPNIDRLASEGILFRQHYSGCTVSAPSRSSLMTGMHTGHTPIRGNKQWEPEGQWPLQSEVVTIAEMLKTKGYTTGAFGKWGLGFVGTSGDPETQGFDEFFGFNCQSLAHNYYPDHLWHNSEKILLHENDSGRTALFAPDLIHKKALDFIGLNKAKPFFLFYPTTIPHAELLAKEEYMNKFRGKFLPEKSYNGIDDGPLFRRGPYGSQPESHAAFAAMVNELDDYVGELMAKLKELGLEDNTIVIFTSDNGPHIEGGADPVYFESNGPFRGNKRDMYEGGIRVPMIIKWPGKIKSGSITDHISAFWDIMPTLAGITGTEFPVNIDGISFLPELSGKKQENHKYLYWEFHEEGGKVAVRINNWKGIRLNADNPPQSTFELYNLETDEGETTNVAELNPEIVKNIEDIMNEAHVPSDEFPFSYEVSVK